MTEERLIEIYNQTNTTLERFSFDMVMKAMKQAVNEALDKAA